MYNRIDKVDNNPVRQPMRRVPHEHIPVLKAKIDKLQNSGAVVPSTSPCANPTILVKKKDGSMRLCIDYRKLNAVTKKMHIQFFAFNTYLTRLPDPSTFERLTRRWDIIKRRCILTIAKRAFSTPFGLFQYNVMPFGIATAPATFMRLMTIVFSGMLFSTCLPYIDDIIVFGRNYVKMLCLSDTALESLEQANLKLKPNKCAFGKTSVSFLGHIISDKEISTEPKTLCRIQEWPRPQNHDEARGFLGYATYYRKFIKNFAHIVEPLNKLLIKARQFHWSAECKYSFKTIFSKPRLKL